jgi:hypothetical protein
MKRKPLQRGRRKSQPLDEGLAKRYWKLAVCRGGCVMCRAFPVAELAATRQADLRRIEGHHVIAKRHLRREGFGGRLWDIRNGMGLCAYHHARHENWTQRVPFELVPYDAFEFAAEVGLDWIIEREYPERQSS